MSLNPNAKRPHYRTRVVHNRQFVKLNGFQHFLLHWFVELITLSMADVRRSQGAAICFAFAGQLLAAWLLGVL